MTISQCPHCGEVVDETHDIKQCEEEEEIEWHELHDDELEERRENRYETI